MMLRGPIMGIALALALVAASPAQAARLEIRDRWAPSPVNPFGTIYYDVVYDGEGSEANDVTVVGDRSGVTFTDPGVAMRVDRLLLPSVPEAIGDPPFGRTGPSPMHVCRTPGHSIAACTFTPGDRCYEWGCSGPTQRTFSGLIKVAGNSAGDRITITRLAFPAYVWGVQGDDTIDVANGKADLVYCGTGVDSVSADAKDTVNADCEAVARG